jgi:hypothetical protein
MSGEKVQAVRERAYSIWEQAGRPDGHSTDIGCEPRRNS